MFGPGKQSIFVKMKEGTKVMISGGTFIRVGDTPENSRERLDKKLAKIISKKIK